MEYLAAFEEEAHALIPPRDEERRHTHEPDDLPAHRLDIGASPDEARLSASDSLGVIRVKPLKPFRLYLESPTTTLLRAISA